MTRVALDDFDNLTGWSVVTSGAARLDISRDRGPNGGALRLDFDFNGGAGFVVARKRFSLLLPDAYAFTFDVRGAAPANAFEFKLVDAGGHNVWRHRDEAFAPPADWRSLRIRGSEVDFAWGPAGGGPAREVGAIEFAIVAPPGGAGTLWIAHLGLEDRSYRSIPIAQASSEKPSHEAPRALDGRPDTSWRSEESGAPQWLRIDFGRSREFGGLVLHWDPTTVNRPFDVDLSDDGVAWKIVHSSEQPDAPRSYVYLPRSVSRYVRLRLRAGDRNGTGIAEVDVRPWEFARSLIGFFQSIAANEPRGAFPRYLRGEQTYWTTVSSASEGGAQGLLNEDGMLEVSPGSFSIEPFLFVDEKLLGWADVSPTQALEGGFFPVPSSQWRSDGLALRVSAFATGAPGHAIVHLRYRLDNLRGERRRARLFAALRPFQVTPPWQAHDAFGGIGPIGDIEYRDGAVTVNGEIAIVPLTAVTAFGAASFERADITHYLHGGDVPGERSARDRLRCASAAFRYDLELDPASSCTVDLLACGASAGGSDRRNRVVDARTEVLETRAMLADVVREWKAKLGCVEIRLPRGQSFTDTFRTAIGHVLGNRDGPALQPGPRRYARSWIRDGVAMAAALLRAGRNDEARTYLRWYAGYQAADGTIPCCVDRNGADWLPEYDSQGEFVHGVMDCFRFAGDRAFVVEMWPAVTTAVDRIEALRRRRLGTEFATPAKRAFYGLLPESASHEGYLAHPVHAYWDDFWALRGLKEAAYMAQILGATAEHARIAALRDSFHETLRASILATMASRKLGYIPASVELADIDPSATANAIVILDEAQALPAAAIERTFDDYLANFRKRRSGEVDWIAYSPYEIRIIGALVRLGRRTEAFELAQCFLADRRPVGWNQWPEIAWRDPRSPAHVGDMPHAWIGAEFVLAFRSMLAFERERDQALVVAAGVPLEWLASDEGIAVRGMPTWYGTLDFTMRRSSGALDVDLMLDAPTMPAGGIVVRPPCDAALRAVLVDGKPIARFTGSEATIEKVAATGRLTW
jgi:hypothetical protein